MVMSAMVQIFSSGERWISHRMKIDVPSHELKAFIICFI